MKYNVLEEEKRNISKMITEKKLSELNYILDSFDSNVKSTNEDIEKANIYRDIMEYVNMYISASRGIIKNYLNEYAERKSIIEKYGEKIDLSAKKEEYIYIAVDIEEFENMMKKSRGAKLLGRTVLVGRNSIEKEKDFLKKMIQRKKDIGIDIDVDRYIILKLEKDIELISYTTTEDFKDIYTEIVIPMYVLEFDGFLVNNIIEKMKEKLKNAQKITVTQLDGNTLSREISEYENATEINEENKEINERLEKIEILTGKIYSEESYEKLIQRANNMTEKDLEIFENKDILEKYLVESVDVGTYLKKYVKASLEIKEIKNDIRVSELMEYKASQTGEEGEEIDEIRIKIDELKEGLKQKETEISDLELKILEFKKDFEDKIKDKAKYIAVTNIEEMKYEKAGINEGEKSKLIEIDRILRINKNKAQDILEQVSRLIKKQQKYAKIGAETNAKYSSLIDGFELKNQAEKLKKVLTDEYLRFKEYYFNKLNNKGIDYEYESKLSKVLEVSNQVEIFMNYIYNPKNIKKRTTLNRFDELILIEENEIKRKITREVDEIIATANLLIIDEEIDSLDTKKAFEKLLDLLTGKRKLDKYKIMKLEELAEEVEAKINQTYTLNKNYRIHDVLAKIMIFKAENVDDDLVSEQASKITKIEKSIVKNFVIQESKVLSKIEDLKMLRLPRLMEEQSEEDEIDSQISLMRHKYGYDRIHQEEEIKYVDSTSSEIKQIVEYVKTSM